MVQMKCIVHRKFKIVIWLFVLCTSSVKLVLTKYLPDHTVVGELL